GIELYNAARRAGKEMVLLVYEGENHSLAKRANQLDYHRRILEWFGHYLKGDDAPAWITEGVKHLDRQKELQRLKKRTGRPWRPAPASGAVAGGRTNPHDR